MAMTGNPLISWEKRSAGGSSTFSVDTWFLLLVRPVSGWYGSKMGAEAAQAPPLQRLPSCSLPLQEECLWKLTFAADLERSKVLVPRAIRRLRLRFPPQFQLVEVFRWDLPVRDTIKQVLSKTRWKIGPPNPRHHSPNVIRANSSFNRFRSAASRDSVSRFTSEKKRSFSASLD